MSDISTENHLRKYVSVFLTKRFIEIQFYAKYNAVKTIIGFMLLSVDVSDKKLGETLVKALDGSRLFSEEESKESDLIWLSHYKASVETRIRQYEYQDAYELFKEMDSCFVTSFKGKMMMSPQHRVGLARWKRMQGDDITNLFFFDNASFEQLGAGLRLALSRCTCEDQFDRVDMGLIPLNPNRLRFSAESDMDIYPMTRVFLENNTDAFLNIAVVNDKGLIFVFAKSLEVIKFSLFEWEHIQLQGEELFSNTLSYQQQYQQHKRRYKEKLYIEESPLEEMNTHSIWDEFEKMNAHSIWDEFIVISIIVAVWVISIIIKK